MNQVAFPCSLRHNCLECILNLILRTSKYSFKLYSLVHLIPVLIYKRKEFKTKPLHVILEFFSKVIKSMGFFVGYCTGVRSSLCFSSWLQGGRFSIWTIVIMILVSNFACLFENSNRVMEYAIFQYPRSFDGLWDLLKKLGWVKTLPFGSELIFAISIAVALLYYKKDKKMINSSYSRFIELVYGKDIDKY